MKETKTEQVVEKKETSTEEKLTKFYNDITGTLEYYKRLCIQNINEDKKSEKVDITKNIYLDISNRFYYVFKNEIETYNLDNEISENMPF